MKGLAAKSSCFILGDRSLCKEAEVLGIVHEGVEHVKCHVFLPQNLLGQGDCLLLPITFSDTETAVLSLVICSVRCTVLWNAFR